MRTTAALCLLGVLILAAALFTHRIGVQKAVESTDNDIRRFERQKVVHVQARVDSAPRRGPPPAPRPAPRPASRPVPRPPPPPPSRRPPPPPPPYRPRPPPARPPSPPYQPWKPRSRPVPPPAPAIPPPYRAPPGAPPNGPRPPPAPPVPRPAGAPSPILYGPLRPVVYVRPRIVRHVVVRPPGYIYYPTFVAPVVVVRPYMTLPRAFWTSNACYRNYCWYDYNRCLDYFGDACFCYPGLLRCVRIACHSFYQPLYDHCNRILSEPSRCVLSCSPAPYPLVGDPNHPPLPIDTPADVASALLDTTPPIVQFSVIAVVLIQGLDSSALSEAEYDFASAVASSLEPAKATVRMDNVSLSYRDVNINSTSALEVTVGVVVASAVAMNATDLRFQDMMFGNVTNNTLGKDLVANNVLFDETQLSFDEIKSNVFVVNNDPFVGNGVPPLVPSLVAMAILLMAAWL